MKRLRVKTDNLPRSGNIDKFGACFGKFYAKIQYKNNLFRDNHSFLKPEELRPTVFIHDKVFFDWKKQVDGCQELECCIYETQRLARPIVARGDYVDSREREKTKKVYDCQCLTF